MTLTIVLLSYLASAWAVEQTCIGEIPEDNGYEIKIIIQKDPASERRLATVYQSDVSGDYGPLTYAVSNATVDGRRKYEGESFHLVTDHAAEPDSRLKASDVRLGERIALACASFASAGESVSR